MSILIGRGINLFSKKGEEALAVAGGVSGDLQAVLTTIMDRTSKLEAISLGEASPAVLQKVNAELDSLKKALQSKEAEIMQLKGAGGSADKAATALQGRISELEAKLAEYEILEDDIADLSLYKDENAKLKREIEKYKAGGATPAAAEVSPADNIVAEFAQAVEAPTLSPAAPAGAVDVPNTGDPMADFENSLKNLSSETAPAPTEAAAPEPAAPAPAAETAPVAPAVAAAPEPAPPVVAEPAEPTLPNEKDDLFAEFAVTEATPEGEAAAAGLDTDKMLSEVANMAPGESSAGNALEESVDTDKMVVEATGLETKS